ncbi:MAG: translesion DNA synthesis-associated protein ImuA [Acidiferrobacterales bacterium]|nr:translesion DNA synthesis-associated protein ImuA [Acidiferrobacterales bacterium]
MSLSTSFFEKINAEQQLSSKDQQLLQKVWSASANKNSNGASATNKLNKPNKGAGYKSAGDENRDGSFNCISSGHHALDSLLSTKGWPLGLMTEIGLSQAGIGELRLLLPALRALQQTTLSKRHILWLAPPFTPLATSLIKEGLDIDYLTIAEPGNVKETVWAYEQALLSASCAAVIAWTGAYQLSSKEIRRLQLAAQTSQGLSILFRDEACLQQASASPLRLSLQSNANSEMEVHIGKQPKHWGDQRCTLSLHPHYEYWQRLPVELLPHSNQRSKQKSKQKNNQCIADKASQQASQQTLQKAPQKALQKEQMASVSSISAPAHLSSESTATHKSNFD